MRVDERFSGELQNALNTGVLKRIPLTFLPFVNEQLGHWENLFPKERQSVERLLLYVASLSPEQSKDLFRPVVEVEDKMGVRHWQFSTTEQTIQNSSLLAASPYFQEWRLAVQAVFDAADAHAMKRTGDQDQSERRLVLLGIPPSLPLDQASLWRRWQGMGRPVKLDLRKVDSGKLAQARGGRTAFELLVAGFPNSEGQRSKGLLDVALNRPGASPADTWVIDAGRSLVDTLVAQGGSVTSPSRVILLSNGRLDQFRKSFSHEMNTMRKDLADADAVFDRLRKVDVTAWCPAEVEADAAIREFVRSST